MILAARPLAGTAVAILGAGVIGLTPAAAPTHVALPELHLPEIALQASIFDIFTFPAFQQAIANEVEFIAIQANGLAAGSAGLATSVSQLPATLGTALQQVLSGNALDALTTVQDWAVAAADATFVPPITANITVGQIQLAIQSALLPAQPLALLDIGSGLFSASDTITRALIVATQNIVSAIASFNPVTIVQSIVAGVTGVVSSVGTAGQQVVDGIVAAQTEIATALAARPVQAPAAAQVKATAKSPAAAAPVAPRRAAARPAASQAKAAVSSVKKAAAATKRTVRAGAAT